MVSRRPAIASPARRALLATVAAAAGCGGDVTVIAPVIDGPAAGSPAAAFPGLDELVIALAHDGAPTDLLSETFVRGQAVELDAVPEGEDLVVHLTGRLGGADVAYGRTCAFTIADGEPAPTPHLWFARTVKWGDVGTTQVAVRHGGVAVAYHDGSALFVGGRDAADAPVTALERFDPLTGQLGKAADVAARLGAAVATLGDGRVVILGGEDPGAAAASPRLEVFEYDTTPELRVESFEDARLARIGATTATLSDGRVVVFGGGPHGGPPLAAPVEIASDGTTVAVRELRAAMAIPRTGATATRLSDDLGAPVLIAGGRDGAGVAVAQAELWKPLREEFADPLTFQPGMRVPRHGHAAVRMPDGSVLFIGGVDAAGQPVRTLELFAIDTGFVDAGQLPAGAGVIAPSITVLPDGRVLIAGGRTALEPSSVVASAYIVNLDPLDGSVDVLTTDGLGAPRSGHGAARLCDGSIVALGGTDGPSAVERYVPPPARR